MAGAIRALEGRVPALLLVGWLAAAGSGCGAGNEYVAPPAPSVTVSPPIQRDVVDYLEFSGRTEAVATVEIRARVKGFLESLHFSEGDMVAEGDLLYQIDPLQYRAAADRAEAAVSVARASLQLTEAKLVRLERALETRAVSEIEVIEARAQRDVAAADLASARAELDNAQLELGYTAIHAPLSGRIGLSRVDPGNLVGAGESTLLTTIVQYDPMYATFDLSERDLLTVTDETRDRRAVEKNRSQMPEIPLELGRSSDEGYPFRGRLNFTDQAVDPETGTFRLRGVFPNPRPVDLLPGLFVRIRMPIGERKGALLVSDRAVGSDQGGSYLLVVGEGNVVEQRPVTLGAKVDGLRVVASGLEPEDRVIVDGVLRARPGAVVEPQPAQAAAEASGGASGAAKGAES